MRISNALRLLSLLPLLPSSLASLVCYDLVSPRYPDIRSPVDCWPENVVSHNYARRLRKRSAVLEEADISHERQDPMMPPPDPPPLPENGQLSPRSSELNEPESLSSGSSTRHSSRSSKSDASDAFVTRHYSNDTKPPLNLPFFNWAPDSPLSSILRAPAAPPPDWNSSQQIFFNLDCHVKNYPCNSVSNTLNTAAWYVSQVLWLPHPIWVNVSFPDFCQEYNQCNTSGSAAGVDIILGGAVPARIFPLVDDDGVVRYYPQSVIRQMEFPAGQGPVLTGVDILMDFNSQANFWFKGSPGSNETIPEDQYDFLTVAIHELMHGLGFLSSWSNYLSQSQPNIITPDVVISNPTSSTTLQFEGFVEYAFDRNLQLTSSPNLYCTNFTQEMIDVFGELGCDFSSSSLLSSTFLSSEALKYATWMGTNSTTAHSIQQTPPSVPSYATYTTNITLGGPIILETSFNPYATGSSLCHMDAGMYSSTQDFLMRYSTPPGRTLQDLVNEFGNTGDLTYGPFGPGLRYTLASIGYIVRGGIPTGGSVRSETSDSTGSADGSSGTTSSASDNNAGSRLGSGWLRRRTTRDGKVATEREMGVLIHVYLVVGLLGVLGMEW